MLRAIRLLLILLDACNWLALSFFVAMLAALALGLPLAGHLARAALPGQDERMRHLSEIMFLIGIATSVAVDLLFRRLMTMIHTVAQGRPFSVANAARLRHIALALLAIQLLDLAFAADLGAINAIVPHPVRVWSPSLTGWIAVLLLFVLAQVFARGAEMQDELEATV